MIKYFLISLLFTIITYSQPTHSDWNRNALVSINIVNDTTLEVITADLSSKAWLSTDLYEMKLTKKIFMFKNNKLQFIATKYGAYYSPHTKVTTIKEQIDWDPDIIEKE